MKKLEKLESLSMNKANIKSIDFLSDFKSKEKLVILELRENKIENLNNIEKATLKNLKLLDLSHNEITSIKGIENDNFKNIQILILAENLIEDIKYIGQYSFPNLNRLDLSTNKIKSIDGLIGGDNSLMKLEYLYLNENEISKIDCLNNKIFLKLKELQLNKNKIKEINVFENAEFNKLEELSLFENEIESIAPLSKTNFENLKILNLGHNKIKSISPLKNEKLKNLKKLNLFSNQIRDIDIFQEKKDLFNNIEELDLSFNLIENAEKLVEKDVLPNIGKEKLNIEGNPLDYSKEYIMKIYKKYDIKFSYISFMTNKEGKN